MLRDMPVTMLMWFGNVMLENDGISSAEAPAFARSSRWVAPYRSA